MGLRPLYGRVIVLRTSVEEKTEGGLFIPDAVKDKEKPARGIVVEAGEGRLLQSGDIKPLRVKPGDDIFFGKYAGSEIKISNKTFLIMHEDDILAVNDKEEVAPATE